MHWGSYECLTCFRQRGGTGIVFDLRVSGEAPAFAGCPICGTRCELRGQWEVIEGGYGSRADCSVCDGALLKSALTHDDPEDCPTYYDGCHCVEAVLAGTMRVGSLEDVEEES